MRLSRLALLVASIASAAEAAPRRAVLAAGKCDSAELRDLARDLAQVLAAGHAPEEVLADDTVHARLGAPATLRADALRLRLEGARTLFYNGALARAEEQLAEILRDVGTLPPGAERVALDSETRVLRAMTFRNLDRSAEGDEELRQILGLDPAFALDPNDYSPALRGRVDRLRKDLEREPRQQLRVTSEPPGATLFVNGRELGKTPLQRSLPLGAYAVTLAQRGRLSLTRTVRLEKAGAVSVRVDTGFETAVDTRGFTCLEEAPGDEARVGNAIKLAILLEVEEVVLVRVATAPQEARWLTASVVDAHAGQRLREGAVQLEDAPGPRRAALEDLARFVFTGRGERVRAVRVATADAPTASLGLDPEPAPRRTWKTPVGIGAVTFAGAAAVVGTVLAFQSAASWREFDAFYPSTGEAPQPSQVPAVLALRQRAETQRTWAAVSLGVAAAAGVTGVVLLVLDGRPGPAERLALRPIVGPGALGLAGDF